MKCYNTSVQGKDKRLSETLLWWACAEIKFLLNVRGLVVSITSPRRDSNEGSLEKQRRLGFSVQSNKWLAFAEASWLKKQINGIESFQMIFLRLQSWESYLSRTREWNNYDSVKIRHNFASSKEAKVSFFHKVSLVSKKGRDRSRILSLISCLWG